MVNFSRDIYEYTFIKVVEYEFECISAYCIVLWLTLPLIEKNMSNLYNAVPQEFIRNSISLD